MVSASYFALALANTRPNAPSGGLPLTYAEDGPYQFEPPRTFPVCKAMTLGGATDGRLPGPKKIIMRLHVNWVRASAQELERVLGNSDGDNMHLLTSVDEAFEQWEVRRSSDKAPHVPIADTSTASRSNEKLQVDLPFLGDAIALRAL